MGLPAQELYFSEQEAYSTQNPSTKTNIPTFVEPATEAQIKDKIKIIGIGGGGRNALNHIINSGMDDVSFLAVDTDVRNLEMSRSPNKVILGTKGTGAGCIPKNGEDAARESLSDVIDFMRGADMIYLTAGMGGGTGTGVIPVIANAARNMGILTVAVVTKPFAFEGPRKMRMAQEGIDKLRKEVDALMVIPNEKLLSICEQDVGIQEAFAKADEVLCQAVTGVTELITKAGMVNMDFADIKAVMKQSGVAVMGTGCARGENRISEALKQAMESPLMESSPANAKGVLMNITSNGSLTLFELQEAAESLEQCIAEDATFIWGSVEDPEVGENVKITVIAAGIDETATPVRQEKTTQDKFAEKAQVSAEEQEPTYLKVSLPKHTANCEIAESFIPSWLRSEKTAVVTKNEEAEIVQEQEIVEQKVAEEEIATEEPLFEEKKSLFDIPSIIRKKTAPRLD